MPLPQRRLRRRGFSLIELGIVIAVIAVLAGVVIGGAGYFRAAKQRTALDLVGTIRKAASQYSLRHLKGLSYGRNANVNDPQNVSMRGLRGEGFLPANVATPWGDPNITLVPATGAAGTPCADYACITITMPVPAEECADGDNSYLIVNLKDRAIPGGAACRNGAVVVTLR